MAQKLIPWNTGGGNIVVNYSGSGNDTVTVGSDTDNNSLSPRSQVLTITTTAGGTISRTVTITQSGKSIPVGTVFNFAYTGTVQSQELPAGTYKLQVWGAQGGSNPADSTYGITTVAGGKGGYSEGILTLTSPTTLYIFVGGQPSTSSTNGGWNGGGGGSGTSTNGTPETATYGLGVSKVGRGGGATDIALTSSTMSYSSYRTNRSSASLLSRFIVAGGGSGGVMALKRVTTNVAKSQIIDTTTTIDVSSVSETAWIINGSNNWQDTTSLGTYASKMISVSSYKGKSICFTSSPSTSYAFVKSIPPNATGAVQYAEGVTATTYGSSFCVTVPSDAEYIYILTKYDNNVRTPSNILESDSTLKKYTINSSNVWTYTTVGGSKLIDVSSYRNKTCNFTVSTSTSYAFLKSTPVSGQAVSYAGSQTTYYYGNSCNRTIPSDATYLYILVLSSSIRTPSNVTISWNEAETTDTYSSQVGYAGGGVEGKGGSGSSSYQETQSSAGPNGDFGYGANQRSTSYRYVGGCGGAGWYGGGTSYGNNTTSMSGVSLSGGGSGFVNISENSSYRPSGYTGLELDSGATYAGNTSFPSTSGSTETGHSGDGYARITCVDPNSLVPLTFDILGSGTIGWKTSNSSLTRTIQYKKNNGSWTNITSSTSGVTISVSNGDVVQFRGSSTAFATSSYYNYFTATCDFNVRGNIMSMFSNSGFESLTTIPASYALKGLFYENTHLKDASALLMPATTLATYCYQNMFYGCTNMTGVPALPATTTQGRCYYRMFYNCSNITTAPVLNAATVATYGYYQMFYGCSKLNYIKCLATSISASNAVNGWVNGVAATGTFVKAASMSSWTTGNAGIPSGWTVQDA